MKKTLVILIAIAILTTISTSAIGQEVVASRAQLVAHGGASVGEDLALAGDFLPSPNLSQGLSPLAYLILDWSSVSWMTISPSFGFDFGNEEPIVSLRLAPRNEMFWGWFNLEATVPTGFGYAFGQVEVKPLEWFSTGLEYEFWGSLDEANSWSLGGGPNAVFHLGSLDIELAVQLRGLEDGIELSMFTRAHIFLF